MAREAGSQGVARDPEAVGVARAHEAKTDIGENKAIAKDFDELRAGKKTLTAEQKADLAEAKARTKFVRDLSSPRSAAEVSLMAMPHANDLITPISEEDAANAWDSRKELREIEKRETERNAELLKQTAEDYQYFIRCRSCYGHAIYLTRPISEGEVIKDGMWFARYKPDADMPWRQKIVCQRCLMQDVERDISIEIIDWRKGWFRADPRWVRRVSKNPTEQAREGSTRVFEMPLTSQNVIGTIPDRPVAR